MEQGHHRPLGKEHGTAVALTLESRVRAAYADNPRALCVVDEIFSAPVGRVRRPARPHLALVHAEA